MSGGWHYLRCAGICAIGGTYLFVLYLLKYMFMCKQDLLVNKLWLFLYLSMWFYTLHISVVYFYY